MSTWETKSSSIVVEGMPAPFYEPTLTPVPPRKRNCVGDDCPFIETQECYITKHHLFFEHAGYLALGYPYDQLVNDSHSIINIARCRHTSPYPTAWHNLYSYTVLPKEEVAERYIDESSVLQRLGVLIRDMSRDVNSFFDESPTKRWRNYGQGVYKAKLEKVEEKSVEFKGLIATLGDIEIIPSTIVGRTLTGLGTTRNILIKQANEVPELAKIKIAALPTMK